MARRKPSSLQASGPGLSVVAIASLAVPLRHYSDFAGPQRRQETNLLHLHETAIHCLMACFWVPDGFASPACELADAPVHPVIPNLTSTYKELRGFRNSEQFEEATQSTSSACGTATPDVCGRLHDRRRRGPEATAASSRDSISPVTQGPAHPFQHSRAESRRLRNVPAKSTAAPRCRTFAWMAVGLWSSCRGVPLKSSRRGAARISRPGGSSSSSLRSDSSAREDKNESLGCGGAAARRRPAGRALGLLSSCPPAQPSALRA